MQSPGGDVLARVRAATSSLGRRERMPWLSKGLQKTHIAAAAALDADATGERSPGAIINSGEGRLLVTASLTKPLSSTTATAAASQGHRHAHTGNGTEPLDTAADAPIERQPRASRSDADRAPSPVTGAATPQERILAAQVRAQAAEIARLKAELVASAQSVRAAVTTIGALQQRLESATRVVVHEAQVGIICRRCAEPLTRRLRADAATQLPEPIAEGLSTPALMAQLRADAEARAARFMSIAAGSGRGPVASSCAPLAQAVLTSMPGTMAHEIGTEAGADDEEVAPLSPVAALPDAHYAVASFAQPVGRPAALSRADLTLLDRPLPDAPHGQQSMMRSPSYTYAGASVPAPPARSPQRTSRGTSGSCRDGGGSASMPRPPHPPVGATLVESHYRHPFSGAPPVMKIPHTARPRPRM
jgi:hypothetical protein